MSFQSISRFLLLLVLLGYAHVALADKHNQRSGAKVTLANLAEGDYDIKYLRFNLSVTDTSTYIKGDVATTAQVVAAGGAAAAIAMVSAGGGAGAGQRHGVRSRGLLLRAGRRARVEGCRRDGNRHGRRERRHPRQ